MIKKGLYVFSGIVGICIGILLHCSFMLVEAGGCYMLPLIEPGQNVLVYLNEDDVREGDIVAVRAPYYTLEGEGTIIFRRVEEIDDKGMTLVYDAEMTTDEKLFLSKEELVGKVILLDK